MFQRAARIVALTAVLTHLWVSMIVAPWHHLVAHTLPAASVNQGGDARPPSLATHCHCRHHSHPSDKLPAATDHPTPAGPCSSEPFSHDHPSDDCPVCQVLAQQFQAVEVTVPIVAPARVDFPPPVSAVQPLLGSLFEPVSRGPPVV